MSKMYLMIGLMMLLSLVSVTAINGNVCTMDAKQCGGDISVGRIGENCSFAPCPVDGSCENVTSENRDECCQGRGF